MPELNDERQAGVDPDGLTRPTSPPRTPLAQVAAWTGAELRPATSEAVEVTGLSLSSQRVRPGDLYAALPGSRAHGATYAADAVASGAVAILTDEEGAALDRRHRHAAAGAREPALGARPARRAAVRRTGACADPDGRHRHPGQDHHHPSPRGRPGRGRRSRCRDRHRRHPHRRAGREDGAHHARGARPARAVRGDGRAGSDRLRDGGLQPRAGDGPRRRRRLRRRPPSSTSAATTSTSTRTWRTTSRRRPRCSPPSARAAG